MKNFKPHFKPAWPAGRFNKQERSGIFFLLLIIVLLQIGYFIYRSFPSDERAFLKVDSETQAQIDILKIKAAAGDSIKIFPFNPNFITDYKGYTLGMSVAEIDRLHAFRKKDKFVNSLEEFQQVTQISDSLLATISPYFKFPEWTQKGKQLALGSKQKSVQKWYKNADRVDIMDLNSATAQELKSVNGIGEKLSVRIVKFRDRLGGFLVDEQLHDVYGLEAEVVERALKRFKVLNIPQIEKININTASVEMLTKLIYLQKNVAVNIVNYRNSKGSIDSFEELATIEDFPADKIDRIALYLSLKE